MSGGVLYLPSFANLGGLQLGGAEASGVIWDLDDVQGWGSPASTLETIRKPRSNGSWAGKGYLPARTLSLTGTVEAPTTDLLTDALDRLSTACSLDDTTLTITEANRSRACTVRRQGEVLANMLSNTQAAWSVQVVALDPRKYGSTVIQSTALPSSSGGATWPITFPLTFTGVTNSGTLSIPNAGNIAAPVKIRIDGPVVGPIVTHISSGTALVFSSSLALGVGEFLLIDMENRSVLANGQSSRAGYVVSRGWFGADPGPNQYGFNAQVFNSSALMTVTVPSGAWS